LAGGDALRHCLNDDPPRCSRGPISLFTNPDLGVHHADLAVHEPDLGVQHAEITVHATPILAFTIPRCVHGRGATACRARRVRRPEPALPPAPARSRTAHHARRSSMEVGVRVEADTTIARDECHIVSAYLIFVVAPGSWARSHNGPLPSAGKLPPILGNACRFACHC
jgi:hypothetical protein